MTFLNLSSYRAGTPDADVAAVSPAVALLAPVFEAAHRTWHVTPRLRMVRCHGVCCPVPEFVLCGASGDHPPVRVAIFAGFHPSRLEPIEALVRVLLRAAYRPAEIDGLHLLVLPIVNPSLVSAPGSPHPNDAHAPTPIAKAFHRPEPPADVLITLNMPARTTELLATVNDRATAARVVAPAVRSAGAQFHLETGIRTVEGPCGLREFAHEFGVSAEAGAIEIHLHGAGKADHATRTESLAEVVLGVLRRFGSQPELARSAAGAL